MARKGSAVRTGAFVAGGIALLAAVALALGSGGWFRASAERVAVFGESLQGLQIGAPVTYQGVPVGSVQRIGGTLAIEHERVITTGVVLALEGGVITADEAGLDIGEIIDRLVDRGLRAQLATQSFVTGALYVRLVFAPDADPYPAPERFLGEPVIPAIPSDRERLGRFAESLGQDLPNALAQLTAAADNLAATFDDDNRESITQTLAGLSAFSQSLGAAGPDIITATQGASDTLANLREATDALKGVAAEVSALVEQNRDAVASTLQGADAATAAAAGAAGEFRALAAENRAAIREFTQEGLPQYRALAVEATAMARRISSLADRLEQEGAGFLLGGQNIREYRPRTQNPR